MRYVPYSQSEEALFDMIRAAFMNPILSDLIWPTGINGIKYPVRFELI